MIAMAGQALGVVSLWIFFNLQLNQVQPALGEATCIRHECSSSSNSASVQNKGQPYVLRCNQSLIMVSDVTSGLLSQRNSTALESVKRKCMGRTTCDVHAVCSLGPELVVHYTCMDASPMKKECSKSIVTGKFGHIRSSYYPKMTQRPSYRSSEYLCHWTIHPPNGSLVDITILDIMTSGTNDDCDAGLVVSGKSCEGEGHSFASRILCGGEDGSKLVRCEKVDIRLRMSKRVYPLRFWLLYQVYPIGQSQEKASSLPCLFNKHTHGKGPSVTGKETGLAAGKQEQANITNVLITLLAVISGVSIILIVILAVLCVRWRTLQFQRSEPLYSYSDVSPGLQAHYEYISSLEPDLDKARPELVDGYFEVADALPVQDRGETPTSPAYAEVEQFPQLKRQILWDESSRTASPEGAQSSACPGTPQRDSDGARPDSVEAVSQSSSLADIPSRSGGGRAKRTVLDRLKGMPSLAFGERDKRSSPRGELSPKLNGSRNSNGGPNSKSKGNFGVSGSTRYKIGRLFGSREDVASPDIPDTASEAGSEPAYETVEDFVPISVSKSRARLKTEVSDRPALPSTGPPSNSRAGKSSHKLIPGHHIPQTHNVYNQPAPSVVDKSVRGDTKSEKAGGDRKDKMHYITNPKAKTALHSPATAAKLAKTKHPKAPSAFTLNIGKKTHVEPSSQTLAESVDPVFNTNSPSAKHQMASSSTKKPSNVKQKDSSASVQTEASGTKNNNYKRAAMKDMPRSKGIVKNGIQKFEQNSSTSNE